MLSEINYKKTREAILTQKYKHRAWLKRYDNRGLEESQENQTINQTLKGPNYEVLKEDTEK